MTPVFLEFLVNYKTGDVGGGAGGVGSSCKLWVSISVN